MNVRPDPAYYLIVAGGALTVFTSWITLMLSLGFGNNRFLPTTGIISPLVAIPLTLIPALVVLFFGQRYMTRPKKSALPACLVALMSLISMFALMASDSFYYVGVFFSGPPITFVGALLSILISRQQSPAKPEPLA